MITILFWVYVLMARVMDAKDAKREHAHDTPTAQCVEQRPQGQLHLSAGHFGPVVFSLETVK
jgi:hypothetical protein